jgi:outer membrane receptor protein involved in Fe transport
VKTISLVFSPAASFAWNIKSENFLRNVRSLSNLKLRLSHGITGNQAAVGPYQSLATAAAGSDYAFNNSYTRGIAPIGVANPDLRWEKSTQSNIGIDADFFNNRMSFVADIYYKKTEDLLFNKALPLSSGYRTVTGNFAALENRGVELALSGSPIRTNDFTWSLNANLTINRNKLLRLADDSTRKFDINNYNVLLVGQPLGLFMTYVFDGIHQTGQTILPGQPVTNPRAVHRRLRYFRT